MEENIKIRLNSILKRENKYPFILEGVKKDDFARATFLSASIPSSMLCVINEKDGPAIPEWVRSVEERSDAKTNLLVIEGIDRVSKEQQEIFIPLFKHKALNGYPLPENLQIVAIINVGSREKLSKEILSLALFYKLGD